MVPVETSFQIRPELLAGQVVLLAALVFIFIKIRKALGYTGVFFSLALLGCLVAGYHGLVRLNNSEIADDMAGAILVALVVLAFTGMALYLRRCQGRKME